MSPYWCAECSFPGWIEPGEPDPDWRCWACGGPVASDFQLRVWNNPAFAAMLDERIAQLDAGEAVELAGHPGVLFAPGAAVELLLLEEFGGA